MEYIPVILICFVVFAIVVCILCFYFDNKGYAIYRKVDIEKRLDRILESSNNKIEILQIEIDKKDYAIGYWKDKSRDVKQAYETWSQLLLDESKQEYFLQIYDSPEKVNEFYRNRLTTLNTLVEKDMSSETGQIINF